MSNSQVVISVTDRATKAAVSATTALVKASQELATLAQGAESVSQEIQFRQQELGQINAQYDEKLAEAKAALRIKVLDNEDVVLENLLKARGLTTITPQAFGDLQYQLDAAVSSNEETIAAAVSAAKSEAARELNARLATLTSAHKVEIAELTANSKAKDDRIELLGEQLDAARDDLKAERETRLAVAQAESGRQGVVVNAGK